ncbi:MAG: hypothetical protein J0M20_13890 [Burkholderiales bacterium]|jgi:hypothetical protein|nr:hypothetical protein [Burkholderiales bacterium]
MRVTLRWLLISLLVLTLPLKGLAAAGYMVCGPKHSGSSVAQHQHAAGTPADHHHAELSDSLAAAQAVMDEAQAEATAVVKAAMPADMKCTQCAPCCGAVAPHAEAFVLATEVNANTVLAQVRSLDLGGGTDRLERPPRSFLV